MPAILNENSMYNILKNWEIIELNNVNYQSVKEMYWKDAPKIIGTDTETDGLNLLRNKPFDYIFGWATETHRVVFCWTDEEAPYMKYEWQQILDNGTYKYHFAWNAVFDACMLLNVGIDIRRNIADGQALLRLVQKADNTWESKALKKVAVKYLAPDADTFEQELKEFLKTKKREWNSLKNKQLFNGLKATVIAKMDKDEWPQEYIDWLQQNPEPNYTNIPKELLRKYDSADVILLLELVLKLMPIVVQSGQRPIFETECKIIPAVIEQVRTGIKLDIPYLKKAKKVLKDTIAAKKEKLYKILGEEINPSQNEKIAVWLESQGIRFPEVTVFDKRKNKMITKIDYKADKDFLLRCYKKLGAMKVDDTWPTEKKARREKIMLVCELVPELRTFEKWLATYIDRILENAEEYGDGRFHSRYDAYGAVSGRFTSDFQQFPRGGIMDNGVELLNPRRAFIVDEDYALVYIDYSQIELRLAGTMTIIAGKPDEVVLNAYTNWNKVDNWHPTDMHLAMAKNAFDLTDEEIALYERYENGDALEPQQLKIAKQVKEKRSLAKIANFSALYSGGPNAINQGLFDGQDLEQAKKVSRAHETTFPGLHYYQQWVANQVILNGQVKNLMGRVYSFAKGDSHAQRTAANYIIQGTGADFLKSRMAAVYEHLKGTKSKIVGNIHDEMQFLIHKDELHLIPELKKIMESNADFSKIPIVADVEITWSSWADKRNWHEEEN